MKTLIGKTPARRPNPLNDFIFKKVMGEKGDESQLRGFLNAVLDRHGGREITSVRIIGNKTLTPDFIGDKASVLDVRAALADGSRINIEVQLHNEKNMERRSLFYWGREYTRSLKAGRDYRELPVVIAINIVDYEFFEAGGFHTCFRLREDAEHDLVLTDALEIHFLDMVKWRKQEGKDMGEPLHQWMAWLNEKSPPELIDEVKKMNEAILMADEKMVFVTEDEEAIDAYERRQKALFDLTSMRNYALEEGHREGRQEGLAEGIAEGITQGMAQGITQGRTDEKLEIAQKLKARGQPLEEIAEITGLSVKELGGI